MPDLQAFGVRGVLIILGAQCLGGMLWFTAWVWLVALRRLTEAVGITGAFMEYCFHNIGKKWWGKWR